MSVLWDHMLSWRASVLTSGVYRFTSYTSSCHQLVNSTLVTIILSEYLDGLHVSASYTVSPSPLTHVFPKESKSENESHSVVSYSLWPHGLYSSWNSPGHNNGVSSHSLLQGIFPTQEPNPGLPHCRWILYQLSNSGFPGGAGGKEPDGQCKRCKRPGFHPWVGNIPREGDGNTLQYYGLRNSMDRGPWQAIVHGVTKSQTWLY